MYRTYMVCVRVHIYFKLTELEVKSLETIFINAISLTLIVNN